MILCWHASHKNIFLSSRRMLQSMLLVALNPFVSYLFLLILSLIVISPKLSSFSALSCVFQRPAWPDSKRSDQVHFMQLLLCTLHGFVDKQVPMLIWGDILRHPTTSYATSDNLFSKFQIAQLRWQTGPNVDMRRHTSYACQATCFSNSRQLLFMKLAKRHKQVGETSFGRLS